MKKILGRFLKVFSIAALLVLGLVLAFAFSMRGGDANSPFRGVRTYDSTPIKIEMGKYHYEIPAHYFDLQPKFNCNMHSALFVALLPDFIGRSAENDAEFSKTGWWRNNAMILILVGGGSSATLKRLIKREY